MRSRGHLEAGGATRGRKLGHGAREAREALYRSESPTEGGGADDLVATTNASVGMPKRSKVDARLHPVVVSTQRGKRGKVRWRVSPPRETHET